VRRRPDLARLVGAGLISQSGDWLLAVGLSYAVYELTGSTMASAGVFLTSLLPQVLAGQLAGPPWWCWCSGRSPSSRRSGRGSGDPVRALRALGAARGPRGAWPGQRRPGGSPGRSCWCCCAVT